MSQCEPMISSVEYDTMSMCNNDLDTFKVLQYLDLHRPTFWYVAILYMPWMSCLKVYSCLFGHISPDVIDYLLYNKLSYGNHNSDHTVKSYHSNVIGVDRGHPWEMDSLGNYVELLRNTINMVPIREKIFDIDQTPISRLASLINTVSDWTSIVLPHKTIVATTIHL